MQIGVGRTSAIASLALAVTFAACSKSEPSAGKSTAPTPAVGAKPATTVGIYRPSKATFYLHTSNKPGDPEIAVLFGPPGDVPIAGDWDGDGATTIGLYRPKEAAFYLRNSNTPGAADITITYGTKGDIPIVGDWDGNGTVTIGVYRPGDSTFYLRNTNSPGTADYYVPLGMAGDLPVVGKWGKK